MNTSVLPQESPAVAAGVACKSGICFSSQANLVVCTQNIPCSNDVDTHGKPIDSLWRDDVGSRSCICRESSLLDVKRLQIHVNIIAALYILHQHSAILRSTNRPDVG